MGLPRATTIVATCLRPSVRVRAPQPRSDSVRRCVVPSARLSLPAAPTPSSRPWSRQRKSAGWLH
eukprot:5045898-Pleurochrysis_carterae.AAC.1